MHGCMHACMHGRLLLVVLSDGPSAGDRRAVHGVSLREGPQHGAAVLRELLHESIRATGLDVRGERADACIAHHSIAHHNTSHYSIAGHRRQRRV